MAAAAGTVRKLVVEVVEARDLLPKDGTGTSSPYARADFDGQRRKTRTVVRDLNPVWNEPLEFTFPSSGAGVLDPEGGGEPLEVSVFHDLRVGPSRRSNFLGRVRLDARRFFVRKGEEALIFFPLEKKSFFGWVRGEIGLKVYYVDEPAPAPAPAPVAPEPEPEPNAGADPPNPAAPDAAEAAAAEESQPPAPDAAAPATADSPLVQTEDAEAPEAALPAGEEACADKPPEADTAANVDAPAVMTSEAVPASSAEPAAETPPPLPMPRQVPLPARPAPPPVEVLPVEPSKHDLVDKMPYLFIGTFN